MDLAKDIDEELSRKVERYMQHLETARKNAGKYYERNSEEIRQKNKQRYREKGERRRERYKNDPVMRKKAQDYYQRKKQKMKELKESMEASY
jgi:hypothetical protein